MEKPWLKHYDKGVPATIDYPDITLHQRLEETAKRFPESTAIIFPGALGDAYRLSYRQLNGDADRMANALAGQHGLQLDYVYARAIKGFAFGGSDQAAQALARRAEGAYVEPDQVYAAFSG